MRVIATASLCLALGMSLGLGTSPAAADRSGTEDGQWRYWGGDEFSSRYSPLDQINADTIEDLEVAWRWRSDNYGPEPDFIYRATPLYIDGRLYAVAGQRRTVVAIDPGTGETLWMWRMPPNPRWQASTRKNYGKGVAYADVNGRGRIYIITPGYYLAALNPDTGQPISDFGINGVVDLHLGLGDYPVEADTGVLASGDITSSSPPIVVNGVIVVGNSHDRGYYPSKKENIPGHVRGYDAATGRLLWKFNVLPQEGEFGNDTWETDAWKFTGNISAWAPLSADSERGLVFIPTDTPTNDYYGGDRPGSNLYGTSLIALNAKTGERVWHYQMVHHDVWNMDNPNAPKLLDIKVRGKSIPAVVETTKQGWAYVFNRETGEPVWPIEERAVPTSDVPGEVIWKTQPHVTKPPPFELQGTTVDDLIDFTPELRAEAIELAKQYRMGPIFTPPSLANAPDGTKGAFVMPGANGGANIPGGSSVDPETGMLYVASERGHSVISLVPGEEKDSNAGFVSLGPGGIRGPQGLQLFKPPYGTITAIDLNKGTIAWQIPNGDTPESVKNHPALKGVDLPVTGKRSHATVLTTKSLLFYGEGRRGDPLLHAVDKATGEEIARIDLPATTNTAPMTYRHNGRQYIIATVASVGKPGELVALALPEE
ncbi:MAG: PQQ-binding-like beta-propeller repeat protein [Pseudomonadota bacterium]